MIPGLALSSSSEAVAARFDLTPVELDRRDPIRPGDPVWIATTDDPGAVTSTPWGLESAAEADDRERPATAVAIDRVPEEPTLIAAITGRRCIVLADGVYLDGPGRQRRRLSRADGKPFAIAGLRAPDRVAGGAAILIHEVSAAGPVEDEPLPAVLPPDRVAIWLYYSHATELRDVLDPPGDDFWVETLEPSDRARS